MSLDQDFFRVSKLREDQKKSLHQKWNTFFPPNSSTDLRSYAHQSQIIGGDADENHTQIVEGDTVKLLGDISPLVSAPLHSTTDRLSSLASGRA